jgi:hypothetical protein
MPSDAATRAGRALALQALGVELALADGLAPERLLLGAVPDWSIGDGSAASILLQAWLRRAVFSGYRFVVDGPMSWLTSAGGAVALVSAMAGGPSSLVLEPGVPASVSAAASDLYAAGRTAKALRTSLGDDNLHGDAADLAETTLRTASAVLERLAGDGWGSLLGPAGQDAEGGRLGGSAVVERDSGPTSGSRLLAGLV